MAEDSMINQKLLSSGVDEMLFSDFSDCSKNFELITVILNSTTTNISVVDGADLSKSESNLASFITHFSHTYKVNTTDYYLYSFDFVPLVDLTFKAAAVNGNFYITFGSNNFSELDNQTLSNFNDCLNYATNGCVRIYLYNTSHYYHRQFLIKRNCPITFFLVMPQSTGNSTLYINAHKLS